MSVSRRSSASPRLALARSGKRADVGTNAPSAVNQQWSREHDAAANIAQLAPEPLLIQHGRRDDMVPVEGALRLTAPRSPITPHIPATLR